MDGPRAPENHEAQDVIQFLDDHLRPENSWSVTEEYPTTFTPQNYQNLRVIKDENSVLSHAAIRDTVIKSPFAVFHAAAIGSVVTSEAHRQQGLSRKILQNCIDASKEKGADFAILWTNLFDFYRKLGFELAGYEISIQVQDDVPMPEGLKVIEGAQIAPEALHRVFMKHTVHSARKPEDIRRYLQIPNARIYSVWNAQGQMEAYAVEGKGADLDSYIHEWGGGTEQLIALFSEIRRRQDRAITVISPGHSYNLIKQCSDQNWPIFEGRLGMIKILNHERLFEKIQRAARSQGVDFALRQGTTDSDSNQTFISIQGRQVAQLHERELVQWIFGPHTPALVNKFDLESRTSLSQIFPLPLWFWGWDSI